MDERSDFLVLGSGIAGLLFALDAAEHGSVTVLAKKALDDCNTNRAQGGIAAVTAAADSVEAHIADTIAAGAGLCRPEAVRWFVERGPGVIRRLEELGIRFSREGPTGEDGYDLGREGGHSQRRVLHTGDLTGREIERKLLERARAHPRIRLLERHHAIDLLTDAKLERRRPRQGDTALGCYALDVATGAVLTLSSQVTVLATGGAGKVYLYTTNSDVATGDGVAMGWRAGCRVSNMEFFQFHPTCLYHPAATDFLISEALRGEGGVLRTKAGHAFMERYHPLRDLAPRDVVARSIDRELKASGDDCVFLDMTSHKSEFLRGRFPNIHERLERLGIDMARDPIPVVPAAHYMCGGVLTDLRGRTDLRRLYAIGETASTGLHGANRLASNSLLEGAVAAREAAADAVRALDRATAAPPLPGWDSRGAVESDESVVVSHTWDELRRFMWNYVGIVRSDARLDRARRRLDLVRDEIRSYYWKYLVTPDLLDLRNLHLVASLIVDSARLRKESRGLHYNLDHPATEDAAFRRETTLLPDGEHLG